jgi:6,7-dimethyl-8-ribityllumazine synthase
MSHSIPSRPAASLERSHIAIVASLYNQEYVDAMLDAARDELVVIAPHASIAVYRVPGAFEIPVTIEQILRQSETDAVLALGLIIRGETEHGDLVAASVTDALQRIAVAHATPIVHEVLLVDNDEQAEARCMGEEINRGTEAARVAVNMVSLFRKMHSTQPA